MMEESGRFRALPSVEQLLASGQFDSEIADLSRPLVTAVVRNAIAAARDKIAAGKSDFDAARLSRAIERECSTLRRRRITRVLNATGVLIHTNLGRAPLGRELFERIAKRAAGYSTLEFDLDSGKRGKRGSFLAELIAILTESESALAVNNNAAAVFLILNTFANRKDVIVSRSELVQIGGGFRIPDIIRRAGARLVEVGTTNQTTLRDYEEAITAKTAMILKVHRSNFEVSGFVEEVSAEALAALATKHKLISVYDLGSGVFHQTEKFGMEPEPTITAAVRSKSSVVCFSGDKLFAGTQAGIIIGGSRHIEALHKNPVCRALRLDKLTLTLLEEVALAYLKKEEITLLPLWRYIATPLADLQSRAEKIRAATSSDRLSVSIVSSRATPGGGSLPGGKLDSVALVAAAQFKATSLQRQLLNFDPPVIGYIADDKLHLDLRAVDPAEDADLIAALKHLAACIP